MSVVQNVTGHRGDFVSDCIPVAPWVEAYTPRDPALYEATRDAILRGNFGGALYLHEQAWNNRRTSGVLSEAMGVDDLPVIIAATLRTRLMKGYGMVSQAWQPLVSEDQLPDLEEWSAVDTLIQTDDQAGNLALNNLIPEVPEFGGYDEAVLREIEEVAQLKTYGVVWSVSRRMMLADNLRQIMLMAEKIGVAMKRTENAHFANLVALTSSTSVSGYVMGDGYNLFGTSNHENMVSGAHPLSAANLATQVAAYGEQENRDGIPNNRLGIRPDVLLIPPSLEQTAWEITSKAALITGENATRTSANYLSFLTPVVVPELPSDVDWYLGAGPGMAPGLVHGTLNGRNEPEFFTQLQGVNLAEADGNKQKIRYDFGFWAEQWHTWRKVDDTT